MNIITNIPCGADGTESAAAITNAQEMRGASHLERLCRDYGYTQTIDESDCLQFISDCVTADDKGLRVAWQNVLTIRIDRSNGCWNAIFSHDRETRFHIQVFGSLGCVKSIAFGAVLAWHSRARTAVARHSEKGAE